MGILAPNVKEIYDYFQGMWKEAADNREQWGCMYLPFPHTTLGAK